MVRELRETHIKYTLLAVEIQAFKTNILFYSPTQEKILLYFFIILYFCEMYFNVYNIEKRIHFFLQEN